MPVSGCRLRFCSGRCVPRFPASSGHVWMRTVLCFAQTAPVKNAHDGHRGQQHNDGINRMAIPQ
jgi:hypothetical protein